MPSGPFHSVSTRDLDRRYLRRPPATNYRPYFRFVARHVGKFLAESEGSSLLDIGCANGAFLHYILRNFPAAKCMGIDALPELIAMAISEVPGAAFAFGDIQRANTLPIRKFSLVTLLTLHSHFDDLKSWLDNVLGLVEAGGSAFIFGPFNPSPVDVLVRLRLSNEAEKTWIPGWNIHSRQTFETYLNRRGVRAAFHDYNSPFLIPRDETDPLRTSSAVLDGSPILMNGAGLILPFALLEISV